MQAQLVGDPLGIIDDGDNVIFDTLLVSPSPNITYNPVTGVFSIGEAGVYYVSWWVNTDGAEASETVSFTLETSEGATYPSSSPAPLVTLQLNGSALIDASGPLTFTLINTTGANVNLAETAVQANLTIVQLITV